MCELMANTRVCLGIKQTLLKIYMNNPLCDKNHKYKINVFSKLKKMYIQ